MKKDQDNKRRLTLTAALSLFLAACTLIILAGCNNPLMEKLLDRDTKPIIKYEISLSAPTNKYFGSFPASYTSLELEEYTVTVTNTGGKATGDLSVTLSGPDRGSFILSVNGLNGLEAGGNDSFTVIPKTGLAKGNYTATVTVSGAHGISAGFVVTFHVTEIPKTNITAVNLTVAKPVTGQTPATTASGAGNFEIVDVSWSPNDVQFKVKNNYTVTVILSADNGFTFTGLVSTTINGQDAFNIVNTGETVRFSYTFQKIMDGSGTEQDPFTVGNEEALRLIGREDEYPLNKYYKQTCDIYLNPSIGDESNWTRIGNDSAPFTGTFDGNGKKISLVVINEPSSKYQGMFGVIGAGGAVKNVTLINSKIFGRSDTGGIAGENNGIIENCSVSGQIYSDGNGGNNIGGIAGVNKNIVENCYSTGSVSGNGNSQNIGGLAGNNSGTVRYCYSTSNISGEGLYVGGISGTNNGTVEYCVALNRSITGGVLLTGRIVGNIITGTLSNNYASDAIPGSWSLLTSNNGTNVSAGSDPGKYNNPSFWSGLGWDFNEIWYWDENDPDENLHLPKLQIELGSQE